MSHTNTNVAARMYKMPSWESKDKRVNDDFTLFFFPVYKTAANIFIKTQFINN